jgi:hypothetical protein
MKSSAVYLFAGIGLMTYAPIPAAESDSSAFSRADAMLECAAFYDAAAVTVRQRPELANTQFLVGNPGRASLLLFAGGTQVFGVQAGWNKYSAMQKAMLSQLRGDAAGFARVVTKYDAQCHGVVERASKTRA